MFEYRKKYFLTLILPINETAVYQDKFSTIVLLRFNLKLKIKVRLLEKQEIHLVVIKLGC